MWTSNRIPAGSWDSRIARESDLMKRTNTPSLRQVGRGEASPDNSMVIRESKRSEPAANGIRFFVPRHSKRKETR